MIFKSNTFLLILIALNFVFWCDPSFSKDNVPVKGVELFQKSYEISDSKVFINVIRIDLDKSNVKIITPHTLSNVKNTNYMGLTLQEYAKLGGYKILHSAGYLSSFSPPFPLGYVKVEGKEYNRVHNTWLTKGIFCINQHDVLIDLYQSETQFEKWDSCIQAGPILLKNRNVVMDDDNNSWTVRTSKATQSFICKDEDNFLLLGITTPVTLQSFVPYLSKSKKEGGLGCVDATALTGAKTAGMIFDNTQFGNVNLSMPTAIVVTPED